MPVAFAACLRNGNLPLAVQIVGRQCMTSQHCGRLSLKNNFAAQAPGARTHIYNVVGRQHHIFVVLYDDDRVAYIAQILERLNQTDIIALVQAYAWLV